jgi:hypothetical protein
MLFVPDACPALRLRPRARTGVRAERCRYGAITKIVIPALPGYEIRIYWSRLLPLTEQRLCSSRSASDCRSVVRMAACGCGGDCKRDACATGEGRRVILRHGWGSGAEDGGVGHGDPSRQDATRRRGGFRGKPMGLCVLTFPRFPLHCVWAALRPTTLIAVAPGA